MAMDRCLPQSLLYKNPYTSSDTLILTLFLTLCISQVILLDCDVEALGGVYCYAFLSVMSIFAFGNMALKVKRPSLPRIHHVSWSSSLLGFVSVVTALMGNVLGKPQLLTYFFVYFLCIGTLMVIMFNRVNILRVVLFVLKELGAEETPPTFHAPTYSPHMVPPSHSSSSCGETSSLLESGGVGGSPPPPPSSPPPSILSRVMTAISNVRDVPFVFFAKHDDLYIINKAVLYVLKNEQTSKLVIVHCCRTRQDAKLLGEHVRVIDLLYPKLKISLLVVEGEFNANMVDWLSGEMDIPLNAMFISCPDKDFKMKIQELRGMRIITV